MPRAAQLVGLEAGLFFSYRGVIDLTSNDTAAKFFQQNDGYTFLDEIGLPGVEQGMT